MQIEGSYGGYTTLLTELDVGTKFYVNNGAWDGEIIEVDGVKHLLIDGDRKISLADEPDYTLDITVKKSVQQDNQKAKE